MASNFRTDYRGRYSCTVRCLFNQQNSAKAGNNFGRITAHFFKSENFTEAILIVVSAQVT